MKRFEQIPGRSALDQAARFVLANRLAKLSAFAAQIAEGDGDDIESVHQLRVFCRRVHAASDVLAEAIPGKHLKKLRRQLKHLRDAAGRIRDCDVLAIEIQNVRHELTNEEVRAADYLLKAYPRRRQRVRRRLDKRLAKLERKGFWTWVEKHFPDDEAVESISLADGGRAIADLAREKLPGELDEFLAVLPAEPTADYERLHRVRIAAKRLRYVLEVFAGCFPPEFRQQIYNPIKRMQEALGAINDAHAFAAQFDRIAQLIDEDSLALSLTMIRDRYNKRLADLARAFSEVWSEDQRRDYSDRFHAMLVAIDDFSPANFTSPAVLPTA